MPFVSPDAVALVTALISLATTMVQVSPRRQRRAPPRRPPGARRRVAAKHLGGRQTPSRPRGSTR